MLGDFLLDAVHGDEHHDVGEDPWDGIDQEELAEGAVGREEADPEKA